MKSTYAHIGMAKTGSKAFQKAIMASSDRLKDAKLYWPKTKGPWHRNLFEANDASVFETLKAEMESQFSPIVSYEAGYFASDFIIKGLAEIGRLMPLIFIRDAIDWLNSYFNQLIKSHSVHWKQLADFSIDQDRVVDRLDVEHHLERWVIHCESPSDLLAVRYDKSVDFKKVFSDWTHCSLDMPQQTTNSNPAADTGSLRILLRLKQEMDGSSTDELVRAMNIAHERLKERWVDTRIHAAPVFISQSEQLALRDRYEGSFQRILAKFGGRQTETIEFCLKEQTADRRNLKRCNDSELQAVREILKIANCGP